ncbi:MAG: DNA gyrase subunit A [Deltaproteobacteria bacterium RIFOXYA12_FULL_58_15]|nr:MAG: DNA gyrase subunit A [Deltaproteobacteria bacterium RIFOXYA12_FULL_58_15]OGR08638.1 MAG: DNA gyrase subunit A [Deltaproteobacteria bacterium RIFOXYB12_FULL_58_9]
MRASYLDYAMSVIIGRALPDVRDGLKPVHRRILFAMHELGNSFNRPYKKSARVVGDVIGKYHPHGDQAVYDSLVRMAQDFAMRHPLVDGQGNFGSVDGDPPAAMRYTEARMSKISSEMLADIDKDTVDFGPNYNEEFDEPLVMPTRFPNLLVNGSSGIAVGMATNIPPHNLGEVLDGVVALIRNPSLTVADLMKIIPGPDFPTGGIIYGTGGLKPAYETGRGVIKVRGVAALEEGRLHDRIVITEIPYQVNKATLIEKIADLVRDKRLEGVADVRDESDREGMRIVVDLKKDGNGDIILNQLYTGTALQSSFGLNMVAIVNGQPQVLCLKEFLQYFIDHRREVVTRRSRFELAEARKRFNIVFGLLAAIDSIDRVIEIIRGAKDSEAAKLELMAEKLPMSPVFKELCERLVTFDYETGTAAMVAGYMRLNEIQAQAILDMRLARLTGLERGKLSTEADELRQIIERLTAILSSEVMLLDVIVAELGEIRAGYAEPRRTQMVIDAREMSVEDLIVEEEMIVTVSHAGYVKRNSTDLYKAQRRGGRGKTAATTRDEDFVESIFVASTHSYVLVFSDVGKVYWLKVHEIPQAGRASRGKPIVNLIKIAKEEKIAAVLPVKEFIDGRYVVIATKRGFIKKTDLMEFAKPRPSGLRAVTIDENDHLVGAAVTDGTREILIGTRSGLAIRFPEEQVRAMGRTARGVTALKLKRAGDAVVAMVVLSENEPDIMTVCERGFGKRTPMSEYRLQGRGGSGVINCKVTDRNGPVTNVCTVAADDQVMIVSDRGMMIRMRVKQISTQGRASQGVRLISLEKDEVVSSVARIAERDDDDNGNTNEQTET